MMSSRPARRSANRWRSSAPQAPSRSAVALALDRQERGQGARSAVQEVEAEYGLRCVSILTLNELIEAFGAHATRGAEAAQLASLRAYRQSYGVAD